ncbi:septal ring lytic transglycosylase RlpA family protein [Synechococcales cyanobacterium C]|uniref:Probable endolytic peptidoglycan transglycosylase RlpA n=1 Tax=Petrachloros mirabilis ULC683 TaxID=2781853 RepID=A0A8K1ZZA8_9CYAN|nr:septal ring lytic transglycosylase RlpA family protein [Petrachloros mirabilis]NCJ06587.1 septal ring lytic transglycosylase RlpA family protein [Petrachloros mirabilis ULC683]
MLKKLILPMAIAAATLAPSAAMAQMATYYSDYYQGHRTASGEVFDTWSYTAAHPSLPFGSVVRVTNLNNGRTVDVRINDRCNCGIDLSRAAAQTIGSISAGVVPVSLQVIR